MSALPPRSVTVARLRKLIDGIDASWRLNAQFPGDHRDALRVLAGKRQAYQAVLSILDDPGDFPGSVEGREEGMVRAARIILGVDA